MMELEQLGTSHLVVCNDDDYERNQTHQRLSESDDPGEQGRDAGKSSTARPALSQAPRCARPHVLSSSSRIPNLRSHGVTLQNRSHLTRAPASLVRATFGGANRCVIR